MSRSKLPVSDLNEAVANLPEHVERVVRAVAELHEDHRREATLLERAVERTTAALGQPLFAILIAVVTAVWIGWNLLAPHLHLTQFDRPPFSWLQGLLSLSALYVTALILSTQRRETRLAEYREQLTLEVAIVSEQKIAKVIELLEQFRRDSPAVVDRVDDQAAAMAQPADPQSVLEAIKESHAQGERS